MGEMMQKIGALVGGSMAGPAGAAVGFTVGALIMGLACVLERTESNAQHARDIAGFQEEISRQDYILRRLNLICERFRAQEQVQMRHIEQLGRVIARVQDEYDLYARENLELRRHVRSVQREMRNAVRRIERDQRVESDAQLQLGF